MGHMIKVHLINVLQEVIRSTYDAFFPSNAFFYVVRLAGAVNL